jgi:hypothetical protein
MQEYDELAPSGNLHLSQSIDQTLLQGYDSPGPGEYLNGTQSAQLLTSFGKTSSIKNCSPTWKIGTGKRPSMVCFCSFPLRWEHCVLSLSNKIYLSRNTAHTPEDACVGCDVMWIPLDSACGWPIAGAEKGCGRGTRAWSLHCVKLNWEAICES